MEDTPKPKGAPAHADEIIAPAREVVRYAVRDGLEVGVYADDSTFISQRALARLCGVTHPSISKALESGYLSLLSRAETPIIIEESATAKAVTWVDLLARHGHRTGDPLYDVITISGQTVHAVREAAYRSLISWYAAHSPRRTQEAALALAVFLGGGSRLYIYGLTGHTPAHRPLTATEQTLRIVKQRREETPGAPFGYFHVFGELTDCSIRLVDAGAPYDAHSVPDVSVGQGFKSKWWDPRGLEGLYGRPLRVRFHYPYDWPQAKAGWIYVAGYPLAALGEFRMFLNECYFQGPYQAYVMMKRRKGTITEAAAQHLLAAVSRAYPARLSA